MATTYEIPLTAEPQTFGLVLAGRDLRFTLRWHEADPEQAGEPAGAWLLDIEDSEGASLVAGVPLVAGRDLLAPYAYLGIGGQLWIYGEDAPDYGNLGESAKLLFVTEAGNE